MDCFSGKDIKFKYPKNNNIIDIPNFRIETGKMTAILGKNGCGKTTLVKLLTALLPLTHGKIFFYGYDVNTKEGLSCVRKQCGIVFQNPDNQFVSPIVEDDIRFGLENHQVPGSEQEQRINISLEKVNLSGFGKRTISTLSGGQKQRAAAAGIIAIENDVLIFDESTSMLDPDGKKDLLRCIENFRKENKTIIMITQNTEDILSADYVYLMADQKIYSYGTPREILTNYESLNKAGIQIPFPVRVFHDLQKRGITLFACPLTNAELSEAICSLN